MDYTLMRQRLVKARERKNYNRKDFAAALQIPYRTITNYENGSREPGSDYLVKVADHCEVTVDWLLGLSDDPTCGSQRSNTSAECSGPVFEAIRQNYELLNDSGRRKLADYSEDLVASGRYIANADEAMADKARELYLQALRSEEKPGFSISSANESGAG